MTDTQRRKQSIRQFLRTPVWTDEKLCQLLAHAESKLSFNSCCCLIGVANARHALRGENFDYLALNSHVRKARFLPLAPQAEEAFKWLSHHNSVRRRILRPIIRAELRRRDQLKVQPAVKESEYAAV